jgi:uncharacterized membrane protein YhaH (DUF805 family)
MGSAFAWYLLSFKGRISRQEFWLGYVGAVLVILLVSRPLADVILHQLRPSGRAWYREEIALAQVLAWWLASILVLWPILAIYAKRLHDLDLSAWWLLALPVVTLVGWMVGIWNLSTWLGVIVLGFVPGMRGDNRFGADPIAHLRA